MTFSEFGRTSCKNDGNGTDHGTANCAFVLGANVKGGTYGQHPTLAGLNRWDRVGHTVDFRSYYTSIIDGWLGGGASDRPRRHVREPRAVRARRPGRARRRHRSAVAVAARRRPDTSCRSAPAGSSTRATAPAASPSAGSDRRNGCPVTIAGRGGVPAVGCDRGGRQRHGGRRVGTDLLHRLSRRDGAARDVEPQPGAGSCDAEPGRDGDRRGRHDRRPQLRRRDQLHRRRVRLLLGVGGDRCTRSRRAVCSTRAAASARRAGAGGRRPARSTCRSTGRGGVPSSGVSAVVLNVTVDQPASDRVLVGRSGRRGDPRDVEPQLRGRPDRAEPRGLQGRRRREGELQRRVRRGPSHRRRVRILRRDDGRRSARCRPERLLDTRNGTGAPQQPVGSGNPVTLQVAGRGRCAVDRRPRWC